MYGMYYDYDFLRKYNIIYVYLSKVLFDKNLFESIVLKMKINLYVIKFFLKYFRC